MPKLLRMDWLMWALVAVMFAGMLWGIIAIQTSTTRQFQREGQVATATVVDKSTTRSSSDTLEYNFSVTYMAGGGREEEATVNMATGEVDFGTIDVGTFSRARFTVGGQTYDDTEIGDEVLPVDSLAFKDSRRYPERLQEASENTGESEALVVMQGTMKTLPVVLAVFEFNFMGGSMGSVLGERFVRGVQAAVEQRRPFVCVSASGGARTQEGLFSLMQMAKVTAVLTLLAQAKLPFISILSDPTMGGVSASFAFLGDVVIAEPGALIGFAGPRVIEQTVRETLPEGFQRSEFLLEKGAIDMIVDRREMKDRVAAVLALLQRQPAPK